MHTLLVLLALASGVQKGGTLYVKGENVVMHAKADGSGASTPLPAGTAVVWDGPDERNKSMHRVSVNGKSGFVPMSALTPNRPAAELESSGLPPTARTEGSSAEEDAARAALEALRASTDEQQRNVAAHAKKNGLRGGR